MTGEVIAEGCDARGTAVVGSDEEGMWWGTERAAWILEGDGLALVEVWGTLCGEPYTGWFVGTVEGARDYCWRHSVVVEGCWEVDVTMLE